eukprot:snap_masked-scaffold_5-processed-gene-3.12-mRNA-1 protein AED:0.36 eAED:0.41 QI:0/-1/0/1/-1/1/1/0/347
MTKNLKSAVQIFGIDISHMSSLKQFLLLSSGAMFCSLGFAFFQEKVTHIPGFHHYELMTFLTTLTFAVFGYMELRLTSESLSVSQSRKASLKSYFLLSLCTLGGMYFTNFSLKYLNYTTRIVFKSSKIIPVMLVGVCLQGKKYLPLEYLSAFVLVSGIVMFTLADANDSPEYSPLGIILISSGVLLDAVTSNYEEKEFFHKLNCKPAEVMTYSSLFAAAFSLVPVLRNMVDFHSGNFLNTEYISFLMEHPSTIYYTVGFSSLGYCSSLFILVLIKSFGATNAEIVKSLRKILSVIISFIAFSKPFKNMHLFGMLLFSLSMVIGVKVKQAKAKAKRNEKRGEEELLLA